MGQGSLNLGLSGLILGLRAIFGFVRVDLRPGRAYFGSERVDLGFKKADVGPERADLGPQRAE